MQFRGKSLSSNCEVQLLFPLRAPGLAARLPNIHPALPTPRKPASKPTTDSLQNLLDRRRVNRPAKEERLL